MSKARFTITQAWQQIATGPAIFSIARKGTGSLIFNETEDVSTAYQVVAEAGEQFEQTGVNITTVRTTGAGWEIVADGVL